MQATKDRALGCAVTLTWASWRFPRSMTTNTYSIRNVAVTATKKSCRDRLCMVYQESKPALIARRGWPGNRFGMYLRAVLGDTRIPILTSSSLAIRSSPHSGDQGKFDEPEELARGVLPSGDQSPFPLKMQRSAPRSTAAFSAAVDDRPAIGCVNVTSSRPFSIPPSHRRAPPGARPIGAGRPASRVFAFS